MKGRPKIKPKLTATDNVFEISGWLLLLAMWVLTVISFNALPNQVPVHFDAAGQVTRTGGKGTILILPIISTLLFLGMSLLNNYPHIFNYPTEITEDNALKQYTNATRLIRYLKFIILTVFGLIFLNTIRIAHEQGEGLGQWFLPLTLGLIFIPLLFYLRKSYKGF